MPNYKDDASYYEGVPVIECPAATVYQETVKLKELAWTIAKEKCRRNPSKYIVMQKMFIMGWAIQGLFGLDKTNAEAKALDLLKIERDKPIAEQEFGNLLAELHSKDNSKDNSAISDLFYFIAGNKSAAKNNSLFNALLSIVVAYVEEHKTELKELPTFVLEYNAAPSGKKRSLLSYSSLESVTEVEEEEEATTPPLVVQTKSLRLAP